MYQWKKVVLVTKKFAFYVIQFNALESKTEICAFGDIERSGRQWISKDWRGIFQLSSKKPNTIIFDSDVLHFYHQSTVAQNIPICSIYSDLNTLQIHAAEEVFQNHTYPHHEVFQADYRVILDFSH